MGTFGIFGVCSVQASSLETGLDDRKIRWIIHEKMRGRGTSELALIQRITPRRVKQLWHGYKRNSIIPVLKKSGRPKETIIALRDVTLVLEAYDRLKVNALTLESVLKQIYGLNLPHNRIHMVLKESNRPLPQPSKQRRPKWVGLYVWEMLQRR